MVADADTGLTCLYRRLICCALLFLFPAARAVDELQLQVQSIAGEGWTLEGLDVAVGASPGDTASVRVDASRMQLAGQQFGQIRLFCPEVAWDDDSALTCGKGRLDIGTSLFKAMTGSLSWRYVDTGNWWLKLNDLRLSRARLQLELTSVRSRLQADFKLQNFHLALLKRFFPPDWTFSGIAGIQGRVVLMQGAPVSVRASMRLKNFSYSSEDGLQVGEALNLRLNLDGTRQAEIWGGKLDLRVDKGQLYTDPFFAEIAEDAPFELSLQGKLDGDTQRMGISALSFSYGGLFSGQGSLDANLSARQLQDLDLKFQLSDLSQAYGLLFQPLVIGNALDDMTVNGQVQGQLQLTGAGLQAFSLKLQQVDVEQNAGLFGLKKISGDMHWKRSGAKPRSRLSWQGGHLFRIAFGAVDAGFTAHAGSIIMEPLTLPLLGGRLQLSDLSLDGLLDDSLGWQARAELENIQLEALSRSLDWPVLEGSLQASIPRLHYRDALLRMDGKLLVDVFGGRVVVEGLKLEDPLGVAPVLETSVRLDNLDLEQITQVFDFGRIQGSLEGYVRNLQLVAWQVTAFDANLRSPRKDKRPHRISQRAIDNLTELGNGASISLSATMLRFFEDFAYDRLALKVRLRGAVAELDGVPNPEGGYYIVKGARLPRIDVIGRNHKVAWKDLLSRIRDIRFDDMIVE